MLYFNTPSEFDFTALTVMGMSAKPSASAIGRFGTGLKYAIAITLRLGGRICFLQSGEEIARFTSRSHDFRGKTVQIVQLIRSGEATDLPFTLDYGQDWKPWMAFREFLTNTFDEGGELGYTPGPAFSIEVHCPAIEGAQYEGVTLPSVTPLFSARGVTFYPLCSPYIYYQGIRVGEWPKKFPFTVSFDKLSLTEDRSLSSIWYAASEASSAMLESDFTPAHRAIAFAPPDSLLHDVVQGTCHRAAPAVDFLLEQYELGVTLSPGAMAIVRRFRKPKRNKTPADIASIDTMLLTIESLGLTVDRSIIFTSPDMADLLGKVEDGMIYLNEKLFTPSYSTLLFTTLLEEIVHHNHPNCDDYSRDMQDKLLSLIEKACG
jgi:hypothetical protein